MEVRVDTYLWAIRMFKTRTLASEAIKGGKVKLNDSKIKTSHLVKIGERYSISIGDHKKIVEVSGLIDKRGNYETALQFYIDHSPKPEKNSKLPSVFFQTKIIREKGSGRPTKKERRDLDDFGWGV